MQKEIVTYNGTRFIRYGTAKSRSDRKYFRGQVKVNGCWAKQYLHRYMWECEVGPIPDGYEIHHVDNNPDNNTIGNFECKLKADHMSDHWREIPGKLEMSIAALELGKEEAKKWHASPEGIEWHRQNAINCGFGLNHERRSINCEQCQKPFEGIYQSRFCSNACKAKYRRVNKLDHIDFTCKFCGKVFNESKYAKPDCCSKTCAQRLRFRK
ncbi:HNH endonuclease signature motif containing protein [Spirosoma sp.]|uniref:HNH endonuclease signature motif containing protein n=1 Tax=Spirosoma sp. TaxID=1899569 RepID=UPI00262AC383|nr:HNH endonuclease signature motif containing protein [Spirosoma sp.]MCX6217640.1 HNH endonuclease signature motif containing protein [Spirosoma sp.]